MYRTTLVKGVGGVGMTQPMGRNREINAGPFCSSPNDAPRLGGMQVSLPFAADEHRGIWLGAPLQGYQFGPCIGGQEYGSSFAALAEDGDLTRRIPGLYIPPFQVADFADPAAGGIE